ncbi:fas apoptotic inhibitory molecule 1-like [Mercenaria mercenaria]|uniref:fas apoptotic inhibitory molecule 1-like n=1 Tax=Mercenaria mercenaria TaxID=6596 RepID=UPI00234E8818|nr:fas apoptotic inhibitory molecule 1-like [Mercenaria mercenaria]XP_053408189.1 fas apoptotic inhibitory molecule 1-like [Mercenaria mercenaria]
MSSDLVATWNLSLPDGKHKVEFEHGTTSGKRVIIVDGKEIHREDWMFKLVGKEHFSVGKAKCTISIDACSGFAYEYTLSVNGKSLEKFSENQSKIMNCWCFTLGSKSSTPFRVVLEKNTLDVWVNGKKMEQFVSIC